MNTQLNQATVTTTQNTDASIAAKAEVIAFSPARRNYRQRDFGVGYGKSSGYAIAKRYTSDWGQLLFRCA